MRASPKERDFLLRAKPSKNSESADSEARSLSFPWAVSEEGSLCATRSLNVKKKTQRPEVSRVSYEAKRSARTQFTVFMRKVGLNFYSVAHFRVYRKNGPYSSVTTRERACKKVAKMDGNDFSSLFNQLRRWKSAFNSIKVSWEAFLQSWKISHGVVDFLTLLFPVALFKLKFMHSKKYS